MIADGHPFRECGRLTNSQAGNSLTRISVNGATIVDVSSFHDEFSRAFRFFDGYGRNRDAWIDCMTDLHGPKALSSLRLPAGESIEIVLKDSATMANSYPEIFAELLRLVRYANNLYGEAQKDVRISVVEA
jgi:RNAse (barnase) inhibitor barstar